MWLLELGGADRSKRPGSGCTLNGISELSGEQMTDEGEHDHAADNKDDELKAIRQRAAAFKEAAGKKVNSIMVLFGSRKQRD